MTGVIATIPRNQFFDSTGKPLAGGKLQTFLAGTTTPVATYQDQALTIKNETAIPLDALGSCSIWLDPAKSYKFVLKDAKGVTQPGWPIDNVSGASTPTSIAPLLTPYTKSADLAAPDGTTRLGFKQAGTGAAQRPAQDVIRETNRSCQNFFLASESTAEGMINRAIAAHNRVYLPAGVYDIDASIGIKVKTGTVITGDGKNKTILNAKLGTGASMAGLAGYVGGSVIKRAFDPAGANDYVTDVYIADLAVVLNHPAASITTTAIQIALDMRNITGSTAERCHFGNIPPVGGPVTKTNPKAFMAQGYGAVFGNVPGGNPAYAGGEKNRLLNCSVYGAYKCVIQDDTDISGSSASYSTIVRDCDIQTGHWLIGQMGQYGAGNAHLHNTLQDIVKQSGNTTPSYMQYYDGYNNVVQPSYIEGGSNVDFQLYLDTDANNNKIDMLMAGVSSGAGAITDASNPNSYNRITYCGTSGNGPLTEIYNKGLRNQWVKFHWDGGAIVYDGQSGGVVVTRAGVGDYLITWPTAFPTDDYSLSIAVDTNGSADAGLSNVRSHSNANTRVGTFAQVASVTTQIDPNFVWVSASQ